MSKNLKIECTNWQILTGPLLHGSRICYVIWYTMTHTGAQLSGSGAQLSGPGAQLTGPGAQLSGPGAQLSGPGAQLSGLGAQLSAILAYLPTSYLGAQPLILESSFLRQKDWDYCFKGRHSIKVERLWSLCTFTIKKSSQSFGLRNFYQIWIFSGNIKQRKLTTATFTRHGQWCLSQESSIL